MEGRCGLLLCESGIELAPGFFQSIGGRLLFGAPETGLPLESTWPVFDLPLDEAVVLVNIIAVVVVEGAVVVVALVVVGEVLAEMVIVVLVVVGLEVLLVAAAVV